MVDATNFPFYPRIEQLVDVMCKKTQNDNRDFFRNLSYYYMGLVASCMDTKVESERDVIPVNMYVINLASSGHGKGYSTNIIEDKVIHKFKEEYMKVTFPEQAKINMAKMANERALLNETDPDKEYAGIESEFQSFGNLAFSFDSGTVPAVKQLRNKLIYAGCGAINFTMDEMGSNITKNLDLMAVMLELYDLGKVKQKLVKNTSENVRTKEMDGNTPANMLLFGTPTKLLDGGSVEEEFYSLLGTGYARRCMFGYAEGSKNRRTQKQDARAAYKQLLDPSIENFLDDLSSHLMALADMMHMSTVIRLPEDVGIELTAYRYACEDKADAMPEHEHLRISEMQHRYFKTLKLAGIFAFIEGTGEVTMDLLHYAIKAVENSGKAFDRILTRERNYVKLAKYIASIGREITQVDLHDDLPFYRKSKSANAELLTLAIAWGYKNNVLIKRSWNDGIEFLKGESIEEIDLNECIVSYSNKLGEGYRNEKRPFDELYKMTQAPGLHWVAHHLKDGIRREVNCKPGFNLLVIDVDGGCSVATAKLLMKEYKYLLYTTKSSTPQDERFRIILPISHTLNLDADDYKQFMRNIYEWLPFNVDEQTDQRSRKWLSNSSGQYHYNDGSLVDVLPFIPKTDKNEQRKAELKDLDYESLSNIERWMMRNTGTGNRSNQYIKYALLMVDSGMSLDQVTSRIQSLNEKLPDPMPESEIASTILVTASKRIQARDGN